MNSLPEDLVIIIFEYLDNRSMFNVIQTSINFGNIFSSSLKLQLKFSLIVSLADLNKLSNNELINDIKFKNITLFDYSFHSLARFQKFLKKYENSVEILTLYGANFNSFQEFRNFILIFLNLKSLILTNCFISNHEMKCLPPIPSLKSVTFDQCRLVKFELFENQPTVGKIVVCKYTNRGLSFCDFNKMAANLPNLKHLVMDGDGTAGYFDCGHFPFKIQKLEAHLITFNWIQTDPRLDFLKSQQGHLKELKIHKLPFDYDGGEILKFIIEEMELKKFYYGKTPLILDGKKQAVKELKAREVTITAAIEMFRQFPSIESFTLFLTQTRINPVSVNEIFNSQIDVFQNLKNLEVFDCSGSLDHLSKFIKIYKNCRNITRLSLQTDNVKINAILKRCLPSFPNLIEIYLIAGDEKSAERLKIIKELVPNLKKLSVTEEVVRDAKNIFKNDVEVVEIILEEDD